MVLARGNTCGGVKGLPELVHDAMSPKAASATEVNSLMSRRTVRHR
jgi:hypothetical protein